MKDEMRQSSLEEVPLLRGGFVEAVVQPVEGFVELARRPGEDPFQPKILAWKCQSELTLNSRPLLLGLRPRRCRIEAPNPRLGEGLAIVRPC